MSDHRTLILAGTDQQYQNFIFVFGDHFRQILHEQDLAEASERVTGRPVVLLIGTWTANPMYSRVLEWANEKDRAGRPRGQCFAMLGRPKA